MIDYSWGSVQHTMINGPFVDSGISPHTEMNEDMPDSISRCSTGLHMVVEGDYLPTAQPRDAHAYRPDEQVVEWLRAVLRDEDVWVVKGLPRDAWTH